MPDPRPSSTSMAPPEKSSRGVLIALIVLFLGGTFVVWKFLIAGGDEEPPRPRLEEPPPPPKRETSFTTKELEPPPLPDTAAPPDAGAERTVKRRAGGGGGCTGEIDRAAVRAYANSHMGPLRSCYERRLKVNNMLQGRIILKMTVGTTGAVSRAGIVQDTIRDREVTSCVQQAVGRWRLPAPTGGCVHVEYPFSFSPRQE